MLSASRFVSAGCSKVPLGIGCFTLTYPLRQVVRGIPKLRWVRHCGGFLPDNSSSFRKSWPTNWLRAEEENETTGEMGAVPREELHSTVTALTSIIC
ncbi:hypothetical protein ATANTOWER_016441 [Ataeniobius toweri]|uniref:Uncharacterized protein n=1 Tax=Ataeniobius toweri TaxID=208326 RepID=A0ABU7AHG5_9TELE|nr:hypothetical protein [Ataeniobius toweri]